MSVEHAKQLGDAASVAVVLGTLAAWLPAIAALVSIVWGLIRIYETNTVQGWMTRRKEKKCACE
jgi:hypothetical protein